MTKPEDKQLGPQLRRLEDVPSLHGVVKEHFESQAMTAAQPGLLPCPFCGSAAEIAGGIFDGYYAFCTECECKVGYGFTEGEPAFHMANEAEAIAAWNTRAAIAAHDSELSDQYEREYRQRRIAEDLLSAAQSHVHKCEQEVRQIVAENARLREALERIAEQKVRGEFTDEEWDERNVEDGYEGCVETARAALKGGTE